MPDNDEIKVGDLVMVVKGLPCCGKAINMGAIFIVTEIVRFRLLRCVSCKEPYPLIVGAMGYKEGLLIDCLKRIDPPSLQDEVTGDEEVEV